MLCELVTKIQEDLEDNRGVVNVMSIDYAKAFNRLDHSGCLHSLAALGASTQTIGIVAAFLSDIYMPQVCLLYTSPSPRDLSTSRMPSSA